MQTKNKIILIIVYLLSFSLFNTSVYTDEFNISATEVVVDAKNNTVTGIGSVEAIDTDGRIINAEKIIYKKSSELLIAEGSVVIFDIEGNTLKSRKATYDKINELITTYEDTEIKMINEYNLLSSNIFYNVEKKIMNSNEYSKFTDKDGNIVMVDMFQKNPDWL